MKNILQIMDYAAPYRGNFIPSMDCLEKHWSDKGNTVYVLPTVAQSQQWVKDFIAEGKRVYFIDRSIFSRRVKWSNLQALNDIVKKESIDVIHTHFVVNNYTLFVYSKLINCRVKIVSSIHNHYELTGRLALLKKWAMKHTVDMFIGVSESVTDSIIAIGVKAKNTATVKNAIQFDRLKQSESLNVINSSEDKTVVFMLGHTWYRKGVDIVVQAIHEIQVETGREFLLFITLVGGEDLVKAEICRILGYTPDWIQFLPPREDLASYYNVADIFISASREEGFSYALVEAAFCNPLLISSAIPGPLSLNIPEMEFFESESVEELKRSIMQTLSVSTERKIQIKSLQQKFVVDEYDLDKWAEKMIKCW